jgi:hypothetical protein
MFTSWKSRAVVFAVAATMAAPVLGLASPASAAKGGNADVAHACQKGGWQHLVRSDGTPFSNPDACVSYGAHGGTLTTKSAAQRECESLGGTYSDNPSTGIVFTCDNIPTSDTATVILDFVPLCVGVPLAQNNSGSPPTHYECERSGA